MELQNMLEWEMVISYRDGTENTKGIILHVSSGL